MPVYHNLNTTNNKQQTNTEVSEQNEDLSSNKAENLDTRKEKTKFVVMQGPLGKIYTDALNLVYSQESQANDAVLVANELSDIGEGSADLFIYVTDADLLNEASIDKEYGRLRLALDNKKISRSVLVLESLGKVTNKMALLDHFARSKGMQVVYSRKTALEVISNNLKVNHG